MNCREVQPLIDGYVDGELGPIHNREIEEHLQSCSVCSKLHHEHQALQAATRDSSLYFKAPATLQRRIWSSLRQDRKSQPILSIAPWRWVGIAASLTLVAILTWRVVPLVQSPVADDQLIQEVTSAHVRSLMVSHLVDIQSSDRHVVKPWFTGKLDFAPPVVDLGERGFPVIGGRLDYLGNRAVAVVVYKRREHVINLFIWPAAQDSAVKTTPVTQQGYHLFHWTQSDMAYWAVSDLNIKELLEFVRLVQASS